MFKENTTMAEQQLVNVLASMKFEFRNRPEGELPSRGAITIDGVAYGNVQARADLIAKAVAKCLVVCVPNGDDVYVIEKQDSGMWSVSLEHFV